GDRQEDLKQLRNRIDGDDGFFPGHSIRYGGGRLHSTRGNKVPGWTKSDVKILALLRRVFPKLDTDKHHRERAGRWARAIYLYFRKRMTHTEIAGEMKVSVNAAHELIKRIQRRAAGIRSDNRPFGGKHGGRRP